MGWHSILTCEPDWSYGGKTINKTTSQARGRRDVLTILRPDTGAGGFEKVFSFLRQELVEGRLAPGDRLMSERDLAVQLGVSRPMLREALRSLAVLGVVEIRHGVGTIVRRPDVSVLGDFFAFAAASHANLIDDVMQARIAIECQAIRLGCQRATLFDFEQLSSALQRIVETIDDAQSGGLADHAFHSALVTAGHSDTLTTLYKAMQELLTRSHCHRIPAEQIARFEQAHQAEIAV